MYKSVGLTILFLSAFVVPARANTFVLANQNDRDRTGYGYFITTGTFSDYPCLDAPRTPRDNAGVTTWEWIEASSLNELRERAQDKFDADLHYGVASAKGAYLALTESETSTFGYTVIGRTMATATESAFSEPPHLTPAAQKLAGTPAFRRMCGDRFAIGTVTGGALYVIGQLLTSSSDERQTFSHNLSIAVSGDSLGGSATVDAMSYLQRISKTHHASIRIVRAGTLKSIPIDGGATNDTGAALSLLAQIRRYSAGAFLDEIADPKNRINILYEIADYSTDITGWKPFTAQNPSLADSLGSLIAIEQYVADLQVIRQCQTSDFYFGPLDLKKLDSEIRQWQDALGRLRRAIEACDHDTGSCDRTQLVSAMPIQAPRPGLYFPVLTHYMEKSTHYININDGGEVILLTGQEVHLSPLAIRIHGEWTSHYPDGGNTQSRCKDSIASALRFTSNSEAFFVNSPEGQRTVQSITSVPIEIRVDASGYFKGPDTYLIVSWPPDRELRVRVEDNNLEDNQICPNERPSIEIWEPDSRINSKAP